VTLHACGQTVHTWSSDVKVFCSEAIIHTDVWGKYLELQRNGENDFTPIEFSDLLPSTWDQFLAIRAGEMPNASPAEAGLRMAKLWDGIQESARRKGEPVTIQ
jgi:hypothetical protein